MTDAKEIVRGLAERIDAAIPEDAVELVSFFERSLADAGLVKLIEAGQAMRDHASLWPVDAQAWDTALEALAGGEGK